MDGNFLQTLYLYVWFKFLAENHCCMINKLTHAHMVCLEIPDNRFKDSCLLDFHTLLSLPGIMFVKIQSLKTERRENSTTSCTCITQVTIFSTMLNISFRNKAGIFENIKTPLNHGTDYLVVYMNTYINRYNSMLVFVKIIKVL